MCEFKQILCSKGPFAVLWFRIMKGFFLTHYCLFLLTTCLGTKEINDAVQKHYIYVWGGGNSTTSKLEFY